MSSGQSLNQVGALPLLPEVAHEWSTMLTVILQASQLSLVIGKEHPTVITFDMALYKKVVQLLDSRNDLKRTVPRLGELHTVMAALRALATSIETSGIDDAWIASVHKKPKEQTINFSTDNAAISRSSQCSMTGVTKAMVFAILSV